MKLFHDLGFSRGVVSSRGLLEVFWGCSQLDFYKQVITALSVSEGHTSQDPKYEQDQIRNFLRDRYAKLKERVFVGRNTVVKSHTILMSTHFAESVDCMDYRLMLFFLLKEERKINK